MAQKINNISEYIAESFGANASYVEGLLNRYKSDPNLVDESWRTYFGDLLNGDGRQENNGQQAAVGSQAPTAKVEQTTNGGQATQTKAQTTAASAAKPQPSVSIGEGVEVKTITGASKKIVE
ncbi:MAG TPA: hypothetical protein VF692_08665, partial [Pyrinomonadaceae bacterium]